MVLVFGQDEESLKLELQELNQSIEATQVQITTCTEVIQQYLDQVKSMEKELTESKVKECVGCCVVL